MDSEAVTRPNRYRNAGWLALIGVLLSLLYSVCIFFITPKKYEAISVVEFFPTPDEVDEKVVETGAKDLMSERTFEEIAQGEGFRDQWNIARYDAVSMFEALVKIEPEIGSSRFQITLKHPNPQSAREILNEVSEAYLRRKINERNDSLGRRIKDLDADILRQRDLMTAGEKNQEPLAGGWEALVLLDKKRAEEVLKLSRPYHPIVVHKVAELPKEACFPILRTELLWGLGRGVVLGIGLALIVPFLKRGIQGDESASCEKKAPDPADVW